MSPKPNPKSKEDTLPLMAPKNTPTSSSSSSSSVDDYCIMFCLAFNLVNAYAHNDRTMLGFVLFVYVGYFVIFYCSTVVNGMPPNEKSLKKSCLKGVICGLAAMVLFGLAYEISTFMSPAITLVSYVVAGTSTWCLLYVYFVHEDGSDDHKVFENVIRNMPPSLGSDNV